MFATAFAQPAMGAEPRRQLNALFISVDDLNVRLGCYGQPVKTPNIDRLAQRGRRFDRAYCQYPLCNPSRSSVLSGWRPEKTRVLENNDSPRPQMQGATFLQEYFHDHGYYTARVGKTYHGRYEDQFRWDNLKDSGRPVRADAAPARQASNSPADRPPQSSRQGGNMVAVSWRATDNPDDQDPDGRSAVTAVHLLEQNQSRPFFIAAGFSKPHLPFVAPRKYFDLYPLDSIRFDRSSESEFNTLLPMARVPVPASDPKTDQQYREVIAAYHACVSFVDAQVGLILGTIDRLKLWDNTVVVFWGDNGFHLGEHGLWRKLTLFEESTRVPVIIVAPGMAKPGVATTQIVELIDLYPTLIELCGLPPVEGTEGTSLLPLLNDPDRPVKTAAFSVVARGENRLGRSVRTDRYRYTEWPDGTAELYDHAADPGERRNLADNPDRDGLVRELKKLLQGGYKSALVRHID
jgi:uncharacterized sulfatase